MDDLLGIETGGKIWQLGTVQPIYCHNVAKVVTFITDCIFMTLYVVGDDDDDDDDAATGGVVGYSVGYNGPI